MRFIFTLLLAAALNVIHANNPKTIDPATVGVWINDSTEAVITNKACIVFHRLEGTRMTASAMCPPEGFYQTITFEEDSTITTTDRFDYDIAIADGTLTINGAKLKKIERIELTKPYDMPKATSPLGIGNRLQEWRLGVKVFCNGNQCGLEINTNRHMFTFLHSPNRTYVRAAAAANNDKGTVFWQNIRMMRNSNTGELTRMMHRKSVSIAESDIDIDNSKFRTNECAFIPDGSIYWSLIEFTPDVIKINGCGVTYTVRRQTKDAVKIEWLKFIPYSEAKP